MEMDRLAVPRVMFIRLDRLPMSVILVLVNPARVAVALLALKRLIY